MKKLLVKVNGQEFEVEVEVLEDDSEQLAPPMMTMPFIRSNEASSSYTPFKEHKPTHRRPTAGSGDDKKLTSPINGILLEIPVKVGQKVKENDVLLVLESMKMKTNVSSPVDGVIKEILVNVNDNIETGQVLITFE